MENARLQFLFYRFIDGSCTDAEREEFLEMVDDPANESQVKELVDRLWAEAPSRRMQAGRSGEILAGILGAAQPHKSRSIKDQVWLRVAATLLLLTMFGAGLYFFSGFDNGATTQSAEASGPRSGQRYIKLPDGSTVVLNGGSKIDLTRFGVQREVSLVGEAYFDIVHDAERPFIVHTGHIQTTVLGTAFNIRAYPDQDDITVTVTRGKVKVSDAQQVLGIINPDEQITFNTSKQSAEQKVVDSHAIASWIEKDIYFDDLTIAEAIEQLEKRFNVSINLQNAGIRNCRFTATFGKGEDLEQILRILCEFNGARLEVKSAGVYAIEGGACPL